MEDPSTAIVSRQSMILDLPPSCIEFCPMYPAYFVVGTYNLEKEDLPTESADTDDSRLEETESRPQSRNGSLIVFQLHNMAMTRIQTVSQPSAILDLHFCPSPQKQDILAVVSSTGTLAVFQLDPKTDQSSPLTHLATSRMPDIPEGVLFLSCAWHPTDQNLVAITTSAGEVRVVRLDESWKIASTSQDVVMTHTLEAWTVAFSSPKLNAGSNATGKSDGEEPVTIYSGGDDSALLYASCEATAQEADGIALETMYPALKLDGHGAGVTAILPLPIQLTDGSAVVATGSYDDHIRIFAIQSPHKTYGARRAREIAQLNLGGGVWRLKLIEVKEREGGNWLAKILASCMHAGARILELTGAIDGDSWEVRVAAQFEEHKSMNYGSDVQPGHGDSQLCCVSTSFYDKLQCLWEFKTQ